MGMEKVEKEKMEEMKVVRVDMVEVVVKVVANLAHDFLKINKVKNVAILGEFSLQHHRDGVVVTVEPLALAAK